METSGHSVLFHSERRRCFRCPFQAVPIAVVFKKVVVAVAGVHRVMGELGTAVDKAGKAIAEGKAQLKKNVEKVGGQTVAFLCAWRPLARCLAVAFRAVGS